MVYNWKTVVKKGMPLALAVLIAGGVGTAEGLAKGKDDQPKHKVESHAKKEAEKVKQAAKSIKEANTKGKEKKFKDIEGFWGKDSVERMTALGVIQGYADGTFQPNKPVTKQEAIVMIVRLLGFEQEALHRASEGVKLPFKNSSSISSWAYGHIDVALDLELIQANHVFQGNKPSTRMEIISLLVNGLGLDASKYGDFEVDFTDISGLSPEEKLQLAVAVINDLAKGNGDKSFQPNKPVTRGEMAAFLERMKNHLDLVEEEDGKEEEGNEEEELEEVDWSKLDGVSTFKLHITSNNNKVHFHFDTTKAEEIFAKIELDGEKVEAKGQEAVDAIAEIMDGYLLTDQSFSFEQVSVALAELLQMDISEDATFHLILLTEDSSLEFKVLRNEQAEAKLEWKTDELDVLYERKEFTEEAYRIKLSYKDTASMQEIEYNKEVDGETVEVSGLIKLNSITIKLSDQSLNPTIITILEARKLDLQL